MATSTNSLIRVTDVCKEYNGGSVHALSHCNLSVKKGEVVAIIGPSGSGKSTLLRCLNLLEQPTSGTIYFKDVALNGKKVNLDLHRREMGMVFQHFNLFPHMTVKKNITLAPVKLGLKSQAEADEQAMAAMLAHINDSFEICIPEDKVPAVAGLAIAMKRLVEKYGCNAGAIQCWNALQDELGIMPCAANAILNEMGIPIVCETDIHGAITALMVEAADLGRHRGMFADWTVRHPDNENGELLQHCGPWPCSCAAVKPKLTYPLAFDHPGALTAEAKHGDLTLARFDGDNGEYSLLLGNARGIDGPAGMGTYLWVEVDNLKRLEAKIVEGPYIHHCVAIHANVVPVLYEACKYIGIAPDLYDPIEEDVKAYLRGE